MKIYEKIMIDAMKDGELSLNYHDRESTRSTLYMYRLQPCEININMEYIDNKIMDKMCDECELDCNKCLDKYLDHEIEAKEDEYE